MKESGGGGAYSTGAMETRVVRDLDGEEESESRGGGEGFLKGRDLLKILIELKEKRKSFLFLLL